MMKNTQGASGQTNQHGTGHNRTATQTDYHHGSTGGGGGGGGRHHQRNHHDTVEVQPNGQRSKSTSHHHHNHHGQYHSNRDGSSLQHNSVGHHDARNAPQPRSHSHAKGVPQGTSSTTRDSHHHAAPGASSTQQKSGNSASLATRGGQQAHGTSSSGNNANAVGHYILGKALGEGTFGKVKLGTHVLTGEKVAVKVLEKSKIKDKKDVERISREIKILKQLHHPNVVQIYEIIETDKDLYLVMEFASGGELFELIVQNQKLKERTASKHLQELLAGVHYIHQLGICHRDLKPENLLLDFDGQLKIVDFGLSNMYEKGQTLKTACGSPCYAAPEMIAGNRYHGLKSDIWSCGVVLYAMLCGYLPFEDQKTSNLYKKIMNAEYSLPKFLSNDAKDILSKIFVTDPNKRIGIEGLKQHPWYRLYQPENQNYEYHTMPRTVNDKLVMKMEASLGFSIESVQRAVENNKHNHLSATYYLLLKKYAQASFKSSQAHRSASVPARVDTRNPDYHYHKAQRNSTRPANENSDSKNRPVTSDPNLHHQGGSPGKANSGTTTATSAAGKYGKYRNKAGGAIDAERLKAPVQDQLVLKNHRREQSANATAGRHNRNGDWGSVEDERRTESQVRAGLADDYEIVISKVNNKGEPTSTAAPGEESKSSGANGGRDAKNSNLHANLRANFASPSPDIGPNASRNRNNSINQPSFKQSSINNQNSQNNNGGSTNAHKSQMVDAKSKPMEVNIQNMKQSFNQVQTPSQIHTRASSMPKTSLPKPATYTHATISSTQRSAEKQKQSMNKSDRQASQPAGPSNQHASSHHRKTKSTVPEVQKQHSQQNPSGRESQNTGPLIDQKQLAAEKKNFSQTQKITNLSKSSGQQPRQQSITISASDHNKHHSIGGGGGGSTQNAKVSDLIGNLNMMSQQKTYFDQIAGKHGSAPTTTTGPSAYIPSSKHQSAEQAAGIEGNNVGQADTVVNVNKNGGSSGIFQSLTSVMQRPIIQDIHSQNLLKRLESGTSDNQLRQTFASRQSQQHKRKDDPSQLSMVQNDHRTQQSPPLQGDIPLNKRTTLQVDDPRNQNSRLSQISHGNSHFPNQPISKTPVTGYQTLDTMGEMSSHELKVPMNPDTDRGVSKSIFYGTQRIANLNQEIQRYSNDKISGNQHSKDFNKTQTVNMSHNHGYHRNSLNAQNERSSKNVTHRTESTSRQSATVQPKGTSASHSTRHQRQSTVVVSKKSGVADGMAKETINNSSTALINHSRQNNGYSIPTQQVTQIPSSTQQSHHQTGGSKNSQQKFQSLKLSSAVKVTQHMMPQSTIEHQQQPHSANQSMIASVKNNHANQQSQMTGSGPKKVKEQPQKTRSQSVSGAQKSAQIYTPASHRKGANGANQTNSLLASQASGAGAVASLTAHYRSSTASSTNKERRGSQPPQTQQQAQKNAQVNQSLMSNSTNVQQSQQPKQRSTSSTNYQSAFLVKSLDGRPEGQVSSQRTRQKSTRDSASMNTSLIQQLPQDRQFQSITHASGPNSSILAQQLEETIFNQSFSGGTAAGASRYQGRSGTGSANYNNNKRNQQVASINELLNVAETLKQSHYSVRPRQSNNSGAQQVKESGDARQKQANGYATQQVHSSASQQPTIIQTAIKGGGNQSKHNQPVVISDLGISFNQHTQPSQSTANGQSELKAGLLLSQYQQQLQQQQSQQRAPTSGKQQQQSLTNAMKQITDGLMMRQHQQQVQASGQSYHQGSSSGYQPQMHQSYLSDLFAKQASQIQHQQSSQQASKKQSSAGVNATSLFLNQQVVSSTNPNNQTQPIGIKTALYSPSSRAKSSVTHQTLDASQDLLSNFQQRTPYSKVQQPQSLDPSPANHPQPVLYGQQLKQSMNHTQPAQSFLSHSNYTGSQQQQQLFYGHQPQNMQQMSSGGKDYSHGQQINLLQHHQNTIQQLSANQAAHTPQSTSSTMTNNFMPPQQLSVSMHHFNQMAQSVPQPQKPPSVPAPSTAYQQLLAQQLHQSHHQQAHLNFYPGQQQHM